MATSSNSELRDSVSSLLHTIRNSVGTLTQSATAAAPDVRHQEIAVLQALAAAPLNLSQIETAVAAASAGTWTPSTGMTSTLLDQLVAAAEVTAKVTKDRKIFTITASGKQALADHLANPTAADSDTGTGTGTGTSGSATASWTLPNLGNLPGCDPRFIKEAAKLTPVLWDLAQTGTRDQQAKATELLEQARHQLHQILAAK